MADATHSRLARGRRFGLEIGGGCVAVALLLALRGTHAQWRDVLLSAGGVVLALAVVAPAVLAPLAAAWLAFGERIAAVTTPVFLTVIYLLVVTPFGMVRRRFGRSPIRRDPAAPTYWVRREPMSPEEKRSAMEHQF